MVAGFITGEKLVPVCQPLCCRPAEKPLLVAISKKYCTAALVLPSVAVVEVRAEVVTTAVAPLAGVEAASPAGTTLSTLTVTEAGVASA